MKQTTETKHMTPRVERAIDVFLDALSNGTLAKGHCAACAVGNLVAKGLNGNITWLQRVETEFSSPYPVCDVQNAHWYHGLHHNGLADHAQVVANVAASGFTIEELRQIEGAFESNTLLDYQNYPQYAPGQVRADQVKGLEAAVRVMLDFDECKDTAEELFTKKAELIPVV